MSFKSEYTKKSLIHLEEIRAWYEEKSDKLGEQFIDEFFEYETKLLQDPVILKPQIVYEKDISRVLLKRFPYVIYYRILFDKKLIIILAVLYKGSDLSTIRKHIV